MKYFSWPILSLLSLAACQPTKENQSMTQGKEVYIANCVTCHQPDGAGVTGVYPSLLKPDEISLVQTKRAIQLISFGSSFEGGMKPIHLSEKEIADVVNYIQNAWDNEAPMLTKSEVSAIKNN